jgi:hypothetical protein
MLDRKALRLILIALAGAVFCGALAAQSYDLSTQGRRILALNELMRFHPGDDPAWSDPHLDDTAWPLIRGDQTWYAQGYPHLTGFAWYRFKVTLPADPDPLALWVPAVATAVGRCQPDPRMANASPSRNLLGDVQCNINGLMVKARFSPENGVGRGDMEPSEAITRPLTKI